MKKKLSEIRARHYPDALGFPAALREAYLAGQGAEVNHSKFFYHAFLACTIVWLLLLGWYIWI